MKRLLLIALMLLSPAVARAQVDPRGHTLTLRTPHFRVHYRDNIDSIGRRAAVLAERAYRNLASELREPALPIELLIVDNLDATNGFATTLPTNRIVIYAQPPVFLEELRFHGDWLEVVITHELSHIFHLDRANGLWRVGRLLFGRNPLFFPNALTPSWVKEGLAVHHESKFTGAGRNVSTDNRMVAQAAARAGDIPPPRKWSLSTTRFPNGQTAYAWGSLLMDRAAKTGPDTGMRGFIEATAGRRLPFMLNTSSKLGFGHSFSQTFGQMRDSLAAAAASIDTSGDARWTVVAAQGSYAAFPRWVNNDTILWTATTNREVTGLFVASALAPGHVTRVTRRNTLDVNAPSAKGVVFAQHDFRDPYVLRVDLYTGKGRREHKLTDNKRLTQPDVRADGSIVAVQIAPGTTHLVRVSADGKRITSLTPVGAGKAWAEPRWSSDGNRIVAIQFLETTEERVVVLDTLGNVQEIVAGGRAVFATPSFTPDGRRVYWTSDRSGRMQIETAALDPSRDTASWRAEREAVRTVSSVTTGIFEPSISPDGRSIVALLYRRDGYEVVVAPLDSTGPIATNKWYPALDARIASRSTGALSLHQLDSMDLIPTKSYNAFRQVLPRYWMPTIGTARDDGSSFGIATSGNDILGRHEWSASALINPRITSEIDAYLNYRYSGAGVPVFDVSSSQEWDATFHAVDQDGAPIGDIARRRRFFTVSTTWEVPRIRRAASATVGTQFEFRKFFSDVDAALGGPGSLTRRGTQYPSFFTTLGAATTRRGIRGISSEEGFSVVASTAYRWRADAPVATESWRTVGIGRGFIPLPLPGFARHVIALRVAGGSADRRAQSEFSIGGVSGITTEVVPGISFGEPSRTFPVRGVAAGAQRGTRATSATIEYRAPLVMLNDAPGPLPVFADKLSVNIFGDAGRAWCPAGVKQLNSVVCDTRPSLGGWVASAGAELSLDLAAQYDAPYRLRAGVAKPVVSPALIPRTVRFYVTLGSYF